MFANIAIAVPLRQLFIYKIPDGMDVQAGMRVIVPFHHRRVVGYVVDKHALSEKYSPFDKLRVNGMRVEGLSSSKNINIKEIVGAPDAEPVFSPNMLKFLTWMADYYCAPIGEVCRAAIPAALNRPSKKKKTKIYDETSIDSAFSSGPEPVFTGEQEDAYKTIKAKILEGKFSTTLLHGITGSGKTEIYLKLFADVIKSGKEIIYLIPEIGLTPQTTGVVASRFGGETAVYHSSLTEGRRFHEWKIMSDGSAKIVVGTRSAIFSPFKNLGLVVVDEEHDTSYKQEESPRYNARDAAVMRAKIEGVPCVLGSATPSLESFHNAKIKKYHYLHLKERPAGALLPQVEVLDMCSVQKGMKFSPQLINSVIETMQKKEQAMLFFNRRGFANFTLCQDCGNTYTCPNCNIALVHHKHGGSLRCHYCDFNIKIPEQCEKCKSRNILPLGSGTEKIEEELAQIFPNARIARLDSDTAAKSGARSNILSSMKRRHTDILVGTQMITKGHDFPGVTLVGIIDADGSLNFPDFRSAERTFQLITQAAGRAGRSDSPGHVIIQTHSPDHYAVAAAKDHDFFEFYEEESRRRRELDYPPFGRLAMIGIRGMNEAAVQKYAEGLADILRQVGEGLCPLPNCATAEGAHPPLQRWRAGNGAPLRTTILGPAPAPLSKVRGKFRWQILIKSNNINVLRNIINSASEAARMPPRGVKVIIDVDPVNML